jgi:hypothetical protein
MAATKPAPAARVSFAALGTRTTTLSTATLSTACLGASCTTLGAGPFTTPGLACSTGRASMPTASPAVARTETRGRALDPGCADFGLDGAAVRRTALNPDGTPIRCATFNAGGTALGAPTACPAAGLNMRRAALGTGMETFNPASMRCATLGALAVLVEPSGFTGVICAFLSAAAACMEAPFAAEGAGCFWHAGGERHGQDGYAREQLAVHDQIPQSKTS